MLLQTGPGMFMMSLIAINRIDMSLFYHHYGSNGFNAFVKVSDLYVFIFRMLVVVIINNGNGDDVCFKNVFK